MKLDLKKGSVLWTVFTSLEIAALLTLGILAIVFRDNHSLWQWTVMIAGILVIIDASFRLIGSIIKITQIANVSIVGPSFSEAIGGSSELAIGILMIVIANALGQSDTSMVTGLFKYIVIFLGIAAIAIGFIMAVYSIAYLAKGVGEKTDDIVDIVVGLLLITTGILVLVFRAGASADTIISDCFLIVGIVLCVMAALLLLSMIGGIIAAKHTKDAIEGSEDNVVSDNQAE